MCTGVQGQFYHTSKVGNNCSPLTTTAKPRTPAVGGHQRMPSDGLRVLRRGSISREGTPRGERGLGGTSPVGSAGSGRKAGWVVSLQEKMALPLLGSRARGSRETSPTPAGGGRVTAPQAVAQQGSSAGSKSELMTRCEMVKMGWLPMMIMAREKCAITRDSY